MILCLPCSLPIVYIDVNAVPGKIVYGNGIKVSPYLQWHCTLCSVLIAKFVVG